MAWSPDDSKLISAGMDGAVYEWRLKDLKRDKEHVLKGCAYASVLATPDCKLLYATGTDKKIKEFEDSTVRGRRALGREAGREGCRYQPKLYQTKLNSGKSGPMRVRYRRA